KPRAPATGRRRSQARDTETDRLLSQRKSSAEGWRGEKEGRRDGRDREERRCHGEKKQGARQPSRPHRQLLRTSCRRDREGAAGRAWTPECPQVSGKRWAGRKHGQHEARGEREKRHPLIGVRIRFLSQGLIG